MSPPTSHGLLTSSLASYMSRPLFDYVFRTSSGCDHHVRWPTGSQLTFAAVFLFQPLFRLALSACENHHDPCLCVSCEGFHVGRNLDSLLSRPLHPSWQAVQLYLMSNSASLESRSATLGDHGAFSRSWSNVEKNKTQRVRVAVGSWSVKGVKGLLSTASRFTPGLRMANTQCDVWFGG